MKRTRTFLTAFIALAVLAAACGSDSDDGTTAAPETTAQQATTTTAADGGGSDNGGEAASGEPILVGLVHDLTGPIGPFGTDMVLGAELAVEEFNEAGGLDGRPVELLVEDLASDRAIIAGAIRKLSEQGVVAIHGPTSSTALVVGAPVAETEGVVLLPPGSQEAFGEDVLNDWIFRIAPVTAQALPGVLDQMQEIAPFTKLAVFYNPANNASVDDARLLEEYAPNHGYEVVAVETAEAGATDFSSQISNISRAGADAIWLSHVVEENAGFMIQARERGIDAQFFGGTTFTNPEIFAIAAEAGEDAITYVPFLASSPRQETADFVAAFTAAKGKDPNTFSAYGYDAMWALLLAMQDAGSVEREAIRDAMTTLAFDGALGTITWDGPGDNQTPQVNVVRVESGKFVAAN
jgi:branched-chain amino acid transport system substrate-binding protein